MAMCPPPSSVSRSATFTTSSAYPVDDRLPPRIRARQCHLPPGRPRPGSDSANFVDIVTFDKLAGTCADWLTKGREVAVVGKLRLNEWTSKDGEHRSKVQVVADAVQFLGKPTKAGSPDGGVAELDDKPADRPALGKYRKAS